MKFSVKYVIIQKIEILESYVEKIETISEKVEVYAYKTIK